MTPVHVSNHAATRWIERVQPTATMAEAVSAIMASGPAIVAAAGFGCDTVRLGNGARLKLAGTDVVTVLPARRGRVW